MQRLFLPNLQRLAVITSGFRSKRSQISSIGFPIQITKAAATQNSAYGSWEYDQPEPRAARLTSPEGDDDLLGIAAQLMNYIHITHHSNAVPETNPEYARHVAATALAAAEANGAVPPLSKQQRLAFQAALEEIARHSAEQRIDTKEQLDPEDPAHWFELAEEGAVTDEIIIKPEFRMLFQELAALNLKKDWGKAGSGDKGYDSKKQGGEVGNISTSHGQINGSDTTLRRKNFAEGLTERAERAAEAEFMNLEVNAFSAHAKNVGRADKGVVNGDAPVAGGGAQMAGSSDEEKDEKSPAADF